MRAVLLLLAALALLQGAVAPPPPPVTSKSLPQPASDVLNVQFINGQPLMRFYDYYTNGTLDVSGHWEYALDSIAELDKHGEPITANQLSGLSMLQWGSYAVGSVQMPGKQYIAWQNVNLTHTFQVGGAMVNVALWNNYYLNKTQFNYQGEQIKHNADTLTLGIDITNWPFTTPTNVLRLTFLVNNTHASSSKDDVRSSGRALSLSGPASQGYVYYPGIAFVDGNMTTSNDVHWGLVKVTSGTPQYSAMVVLPQFAHSVSYLSSFGLGKPPSSSSSSHAKAIGIGIAVAVGICVCVIIAAAVVVVLMQRSSQRGYERV